MLCLPIQGIRHNISSFWLTVHLPQLMFHVYCASYERRHTSNSNGQYRLHKVPLTSNVFSNSQCTWIMGKVPPIRLELLGGIRYHYMTIPF